MLNLFCDGHAFIPFRRADLRGEFRNNWDYNRGVRLEISRDPQGLFISNITYRLVCP